MKSHYVPFILFFFLYSWPLHEVILFNFTYLWFRSSLKCRKFILLHSVSSNKNNVEHIEDNNEQRSTKSNGRKLVMLAMTVEVSTWLWLNCLPSMPHHLFALVNYVCLTCVCVCMPLYLHVSSGVHVGLYLHVCMCLCVCLCEYVYACVSMCKCVHVYVHAGVYTCV